MTSRFALLLTSGGAGAGSQQQLEVLPASATAVDAGLQEGAHYRSKVAPRAQLYWKQSPLNWHANPLASALCGSHVCGDAVLELEGVFECEWELSARLSAILTKASPRSQLLQGVAVQGLGWSTELSVPTALGGDSSSSSSGGQFLGPRSPPGPRSVLTFPQPPNPSPAAMDVSSTAGSRSASAPVLIPSPQQQQQQEQQQPAFLGLGSAAAVGAVGGSPGEEFEPRQQLMWAIASRATSISWAPSTPPARRGSTTVAATAAASASSSTPVQGDLAASAMVPGGSIEASGSSTCQAMEEEPCSAVTASSGSTSSSANASCRGEEQAGAALGIAADFAVDELQSPRWAGRWADIRSEILATVVQQAGYSSAFAQLLGQVCTGWRQAVWEERGLLRLLRFQRCARSGGSAQGRRADERLPCLILEAARSGNVSAAVSAARYVESLPPRAREQAGWFWGKAARRGHPEAQAKLGLAYYKGCQGLAVDCEEAVLWLSRSARQLMDCLSCLTVGGAAEPAAADSAAGASTSAAAALSAPAPGPALLMTQGECRRVLSQVAHILGLLHLDGEGTKVDLQAGIRWLKVADQHGCMEAGLVLGSLYNTGQFG